MLDEPNPDKQIRNSNLLSDISVPYGENIKTKMSTHYSKIFRKGASREILYTPDSIQLHAIM